MIETRATAASKALKAGAENLKSRVSQRRQTKVTQKGQSKLNYVVSKANEESVPFPASPTSQAPEAQEGKS